MVSGSFAELADYFRVGLIADLIDEAEVRRWAFGVIEQEANPPFEVIEIAWCKELIALVGALRVMSDGLVNGNAGAWLLHRLRSEDVETVDALQGTIRRAMNACRLSNMPDELYYLFDELDDSLYLARTGAWGEVDEVRRDFLAALDANAISPPEPLATGITLTL